MSAFSVVCLKNSVLRENCSDWELISECFQNAGDLQINTEPPVWTQAQHMAANGAAHVTPRHYPIRLQWTVLFFFLIVFMNNEWFYLLPTTIPWNTMCCPPIMFSILILRSFISIYQYCPLLKSGGFFTTFHFIFILHFWPDKRAILQKIGTHTDSCH